MSGNDERKGQRVRLRLVDPKTSIGAQDSELEAEMKRQAAAWDDAKRDERPVWLDEIGLEAAQVDLLRSEGAQIHVLRALGRRLREAGRERTLEAYRSLLADNHD